MQLLCNTFWRSDPRLLPPRLTLLPLVHKPLQNNYATEAPNMLNVIQSAVDMVLVSEGLYQKNKVHSQHDNQCKGEVDKY